ncbi:hypothetical protein CH373_06340 [Leptospira perolatii]|uniref:Cys-rich protein n=1 Tax=Leptospira perolatii TaxID=2023191 RepID=A0A2M9ZNX6_9LEPT|nr:cysteine rich repeat-containing protein [Leptospira perolatii]PJZ70880.1 hypothetical protein CH360_05070 [Leptospira perolatii]PJZ73776.1 hypothetical protein CH373_06340 [Leptospira perolatii]
MKNLKLGTLIFGVSFVLLNALNAQQGQGPNMQNHPCLNDKQTHCAGVQPGQGRMWKCLNNHMPKLSEQCKAHVMGMKGDMHGKMGACYEDREKHCANMQPGQGRILQCLKEKESELSPECKAVISGK